MSELPGLPSGEEIVEAMYREVSTEFGALVVYATAEEKGKSIELLYDQFYYANVVERVIKGKTLYVAVFPRLREGKYGVERPTNQKVEMIEGKVTLIPDPQGRPYFAWVNVFPGFVAEVDFR